MLITHSQWNRLISQVTRTCDKRLIKPLQTKHQRVERHFSVDYSNSQGVVELGSQPVCVWVSVDFWVELDTLDAIDGPIIIDELIDVTPLVELENGETLSDREAVDGLGSFLPQLCDPIKEDIRNGWKDRVSSSRAGVTYDTGTASKVRPPVGEGGTSHRSGRSEIRRSPYFDRSKNAARD